MKKLYAKILLFAFIITNSLCVNGMWISRLKQLYRPGSRAISTGSTLPEIDRLKNIPMYLSQKWYQILLGTQTVNPLWIDEVQRMRKENLELLYGKHINVNLNAATYKDNLLEDLEAIKIVQKGMLSYEPEHGRKSIEDTADLRYRLGLARDPWSISPSYDRGSKEMRKDFEYLYEKELLLRGDLHTIQKTLVQSRKNATKITQALNELNQQQQSE